MSSRKLTDGGINTVCIYSHVKIEEANHNPVRLELTLTLLLTWAPFNLNAMGRLTFLYHFTHVLIFDRRVLLILMPLNIPETLHY